MSNLNKKDLEQIEKEIEQEIQRCKRSVEQDKKDGQEICSEDFDKRGELYSLAFDVAPEARTQDLEYLFEWIKPKIGEKSIDVAAGEGWVSLPLAKKTKSKVYAVDPSLVQLKNLRRKKSGLDIEVIHGSLTEDEAVSQMQDEIGNIDIVTSYGGIHHILDKKEGGELVNKQKALFENVDKMLKPGGRFIAGDVGGNTVLAEHFEKSVKKHCLTGHKEKWLSPDRIKNELIVDTNLEPVKIEHVDVKWIFDMEYQMALFMKAIHAYDMPNSEVLKDLNKYLEYTKIEGKYELNWPMLFFHLEKK